MKINNASNRPYIKKAKCEVCGKGFPMGKNGWKDTLAYVKEEKVNCFRGDDVVTFSHIECKELKGE